MSFSIPKNVPSFDDPLREYENSYWSRFQNGNLSKTLDGVLGDKGLPMYKDKPYKYPPSLERPVWKRKRTVLPALFTLLFFSWLYMSSGRPLSDRSTKSSSWIRWPFTVEKQWERRRVDVKTAMESIWDAYEQSAREQDNAHPTGKTSSQSFPERMAYWMVDSVDALITMNSTSRLARAHDWISESLTFSKDAEIETLVAAPYLLGGLLSAHYLSTETFMVISDPELESDQSSEDLYIEKATDLADRLLGAFESPDGIPTTHIHLESRTGRTSESYGGSRVRATSALLELRYIALLLGEKLFWDAAEKIAQTLDSGVHFKDLRPPSTDSDAEDDLPDLPHQLDAKTILYHESLIKQYLQSTSQELIYQAMWNESIQYIKGYFTAYSETLHLPVLGAKSPDSRSTILVDTASCKIPGLMALTATNGRSIHQVERSKFWTPEKETELQFAKDLLQSCWALYRASPSGLASAQSEVKVSEDYSPTQSKSYPSVDIEWKSLQSIRDLQKDITAVSKQASGSQHTYIAESLLYLWRITKDSKYREWGWELFMALRANHLLLPSKSDPAKLQNVMMHRPELADTASTDIMCMTQTMKFLYLLFASNEILPLDRVIFSSVGHVFPKLKLSRGLKTGWKRRDKRR